MVGFIILGNLRYWLFISGGIHPSAARPGIVCADFRRRVYVIFVLYDYRSQDIACQCSGHDHFWCFNRYVRYRFPTDDCGVFQFLCTVYRDTDTGTFLRLQRSAHGFTDGSTYLCIGDRLLLPSEIIKMQVMNQ